jgi:hypothetical protein
VRQLRYFMTVAEDCASGAPRKGDVHDGRVEDHHQLGDGDDAEHPPAVVGALASRGRVRGRSLDVPDGGADAGPGVRRGWWRGSPRSYDKLGEEAEPAGGDDGFEAGVGAEFTHGGA